MIQTETEISTRLKGMLQIKINFPSLISSKAVISKIPDEYSSDIVEIINKYSRPIGNRICNYNKVLEDMSIEDINDNSPCVCERNYTHLKVRDFIYSPVDHVVTGNVNILDKLDNFEQLEKVMKYGRIEMKNFSCQTV